ncbi:MAG TPA: SH3 domain-containing protein [Gemmatimonadales bacterium]|nr:SH3 domain-containing protein [Gemmatimonadales bacterium]
MNLRPDPSSEYAPIRLLQPSEPPLTLLDPMPEAGYYRVATSSGDTGYVWARYVKVSAASPATVTVPPAGPLQPGPGVDGSASMVGCGDGRWQHVYNPVRLIVKLDCVTVTGVIVDATNHREADGVRHEKDGDTHGWLKVDSLFGNLINAGNTSDEEGNLVFEIVCHYTVTQPDALSACRGFTDHTVIPPVGSHVAITGTFVQEKNHKKWNEIHPVSRIQVQ